MILLYAGHSLPFNFLATRINEPRREKPCLRGFPAVQPQKMVRDLKFRIKEVEELHHLCSENKGADQLHSHCAADLRLCIRICKKQVFA